MTNVLTIPNVIPCLVDVDLQYVFGTLPLISRHDGTVIIIKAIMTTPLSG